ncbi:septum formation initiator family protein [bacterium]|nr:septum formation initiator family protein [bacterium]
MITYSRRLVKRKLRRNEPPRPAYVFLTLIFIFLFGYLVFSNWNIYKKRNKFNRGLKLLEEKLEKAEKRNQELKKAIAAVSDKSYIEKVAREKFGLKKPGEKVVVIKREEIELPPKEEETKSQSFFGRCFESFKRFWQSIGK